MTDIIVIIIFGLIAATISGVAGFGGALFMIPALIYTLGVADAIPVLTIGQVFSNASRVFFGRHELKWRPVLIFILTAIPFGYIGSTIFAAADKTLLTRIMGVALICIVVLRRIRPSVTNTGEKGLAFGGALAGLVSGVVGSSGPIGPLFFLGLNLTPTAYIASEAMTSLLIHCVKVGVYHSHTLFSQRALELGLMLGAVMISGSWIGKRIASRLQRHHFITLVEIIFLVTGLQMLVVSQYDY